VPLDARERQRVVPAHPVVGVVGELGRHGVALPTLVDGDHALVGSVAAGPDHHDAGPLGQALDVLGWQWLTLGCESEDAPAHVLVHVFYLSSSQRNQRFVVGWSELQSRVLREVDAVQGGGLRGVLAGELVLGVAERLGDLDDVLAVVALDLDVRRDHRPLIDLDLGAVEQEARPPVLLIRLRSIAEQPEQPVGLLEITDLDLDLVGAVDSVVADPLVGQGDLAAVVPEPEPLRLIAGNDVVDVAALDAPPDGDTAGVEDPLRDVAGADVEDLGLVLGSHVAQHGREWPVMSSHRIAKTRWRQSAAVPHMSASATAPWETASRPM